MNELTRIEPAALPPANSLSLTLPDNLGFEAWQNIGRELAAREKVLNWWIGDWWAFGEHRYGDRAQAAADGVFGRSFQTLRNIASVCTAIEPSRRRDVVTFTHHAEIAPLARSSPAAADELLKRVERENMSVAQVRAAVRVLQGKTVEQVLTARDEDPNYYAMLKVTRSWNQTPMEVREDLGEVLIEAIRDGHRDIDL